MNGKFANSAPSGLASLFILLTGCNAAVEDHEFDEVTQGGWGQEKPAARGADSMESKTEDSTVEPFAVFESETLGTVSFSEPLPGELIVNVLSEGSSNRGFGGVGPLKLYEQLAGEALPERFQPLGSEGDNGSALEIGYDPGRPFEEEAAATPELEPLAVGWTLTQQDLTEQEFEDWFCMSGYYCWLSITGDSRATGRSKFLFSYVVSAKGTVTHKFLVRFLTESGPWVSIGSQQVPRGYTSIAAYYTSQMKWKRAAVTSTFLDKYHHAGSFDPQL